MSRTVGFFSLVFFALQYYGEATRFLPMIVWDHINPQLKCKNNWFKIPKIDVYDRVDFVCPTLKIAVKQLDGYSRPTAEMNENIFMRKWEGEHLSDLKSQLLDGSYCNRSKSVKLHTCRNGEEGKALPVSFTPNHGNANENYVYKDIVVFFNNGNDGRESTLDDETPRCSMVFIANITWLGQVVHDFSYGKCLNPNGNICNEMDANSSTCGYDEPRTTSPPQPSTTQLWKFSSSQQSTPNDSITTPTSLPTESRPPSTPSSIGNHINPTDSNNTLTTTLSNESLQKGRTPELKKNDFRNGLLIGFVAGAVVVTVVVFLFFVCRKKKKGKDAKLKARYSSSRVGNSPTPNEPVASNQNEGYVPSPTKNPDVCPLSVGNNNPAYRHSKLEPIYTNGTVHSPPNYEQATKGTETGTEQKELDV